ncbi:MAG: STAS domain-containing protein [Actinomycetes bacterium]
MEAQANGASDLVVIAGALESASAADARDVLHAAVDSGEGDLVVDLRDVSHIDATGLGVLVGAHRRAQRADRRVVLRAVPPRIHRLLMVTRLHRVIASEPLDVSIV